jgi:hypothetical protein
MYFLTFYKTTQPQVHEWIGFVPRKRKINLNYLNHKLARGPVRAFQVE